MLFTARRKVLDIIRRAVGTQFVIDSLRKDIQHLSKMLVTRQMPLSDFRSDDVALTSAVPSPNEIIGNKDDGISDFNDFGARAQNEVLYKLLWIHEKKRGEALARENAILRKTLEVNINNTNI